MCTCDFHYGCYSTIFKNIFLKFIKNKELAYIYNFYIKYMCTKLSMPNIIYIYIYILILYLYTLILHNITYDILDI